MSSSYFVDISNSCKKKETNKTVENLLEEYVKISNKIEIFGSLAIVVVLISIVAFFGSIFFEIDFIVLLIVMLLLSFVFINFYKKAHKKINELEEIKIKLLTALKQEKFIVEYNNEDVDCSRFMLSIYAKNNESVYIANKRINAQELLLKYPNIQRIIKRKTYYEISKIHSKYQRLINKLCKEKENTKIIYETQ
jgi:hypothetical protein